MFEIVNVSYTYRPDLSAVLPYDQNTHIRQYFSAKGLFEASLARGRYYRLLGAVFHRPRWLLDLADLKSKMRAVSAHHGGIKNVPLNQIIGSEQGTSNFDLAFHPVKERSRQRWVGVAAASMAFLPLPVVELIQIGEAYFVRDGHHRVSVARALKQDTIDAEVTTWEYSWNGEPDSAVNLLAHLVNIA